MNQRAAALIAALTLVLGGLVGPGAGSSWASEDQPRWPKKNCDTHSMMFIDYTPDAQGAPTRRQAAQPYMKDGDTLVKVPRKPHRQARWLVVKPTDRIRVALTIFKGENGYLVDSVERCAN